MSRQGRRAAWDAIPLDVRAAIVELVGSPVVAAVNQLGEAEVLRVLPDDHPSPRLLGVVDRDGWVAIVTEWIEGVTPRPHSSSTTSIASSHSSIGWASPVEASRPPG